MLQLRVVDVHAAEVVLEECGVHDTLGEIPSITAVVGTRRDVHEKSALLLIQLARQRCKLRTRGHWPLQECVQAVHGASVSRLLLLPIAQYSGAGLSFERA